MGEDYVVQDAKKSEAIMNLSAMINVEDTDKVIELLEQNNWDESVLYNFLILTIDIASCFSLLCSVDASWGKDLAE